MRDPSWRSAMRLDATSGVQAAQEPRFIAEAG